jgi:hypothetical protein
MSLSEPFRISDIDVNNELNVLQFWQPFNILHGVGVSRKETFNLGLGLYLHLQHSLHLSRSQKEYGLHLSYKNMYVFSNRLFPTHINQANST